MDYTRKPKCTEDIDDPWRDWDPNRSRPIPKKGLIRSSLLAKIIAVPIIVAGVFLAEPACAPKQPVGLDEISMQGPSEIRSETPVYDAIAEINADEVPGLSDIERNYLDLMQHYPAKFRAAEKWARQFDVNYMCVAAQMEWERGIESLFMDRIYEERLSKRFETASGDRGDMGINIIGYKEVKRTHPELKGSWFDMFGTDKNLEFGLTLLTDIINRCKDPYIAYLSYNKGEERIMDHVGNEQDSGNIRRKVRPLFDDKANYADQIKSLASIGDAIAWKCGIPYEQDLSTERRRMFRRFIDAHNPYEEDITMNYRLHYRIAEPLFADRITR